MGDPLSPPQFAEGDFHWVTIHGVAVPMPGPAPERWPKTAAMGQQDAIDYQYKHGTLQEDEMDSDGKDREAIIAYQQGELKYIGKAIRQGYQQGLAGTVMGEDPQEQYGYSMSEAQIAADNKAMKRLDGAMAKVTVPDNIVSFRWDFDQALSSLGPEYEGGKGRWPVNKGDFWEDPFFSSTSISTSPHTAGANIPNVCVEFHVPKGTHGIFVEGVTKSGAFENETELLLDRHILWRTTYVGTRKVNMGMFIGTKDVKWIRMERV